MDISSIATKLGLSNSKTLIRKAEELRRLSDVQFDSSVIGMGEVVKAIVCLEISASRLHSIFDRSTAIRMSGMSEKAYIRCFNSMQNGIGAKARLDVRELAIQFGCVRLISFVHKGLSLYKDRFLTALPASRRANTDFSRPVFTAVAFYLCAKKHKLKVDKCKLIELSGTSESEFLTILNSMNDLCFDLIGSSKEKKDPQAVKGHRELLDTLPSKRMRQEDSDVSDDSSIDIEDDDIELPHYKKRKQMEKKEYNEWKSTVISSNNKNNKAPTKRSRQTQLNFPGKQVFDKDSFSRDDKMGDAEFDIASFTEAVKMGFNDFPNGTIITTVKPCRQNYLAGESPIQWKDGKIIQDLVLRLRNVETGEIELQLMWIDIPGALGF